MAARGSARTPAKPAVNGPSKTEDWSYVVDATLTIYQCTPQNLGFGIRYGDTPPAIITDGTQFLGGDVILAFLGVHNFNWTPDNNYKVHLEATLNAASGAAGHHLYAILYDTTAGSGADVLAHADLGLVPA